MAKELTVQGKLLEVSFREGITSAEAMRVVDSVCANLTKHETSAEASRLALGHLLNQVQEKELFAPEYSNFYEYMAALAAKHRLSMPTFKNALMVSKNVAQLTPKQVESMPRTSVTLIARAAPRLEARQITKAIDEAQKLSYNDFRDTLIERGWIGKPGRQSVKNATRTTTFRIFEVKRSDIAKFRVLVGDRQPAAVFGEIVNLGLAQITSQKKAA